MQVQTGGSLLGRRLSEVRHRPRRGIQVPPCRAAHASSYFSRCSPSALPSITACSGSSVSSPISSPPGAARPPASTPRALAVHGGQRPPSNHGAPAVRRHGARFRPRAAAEHLASPSAWRCRESGRRVQRATLSRAGGADGRTATLRLPTANSGSVRALRYAAPGPWIRGCGPLPVRVFRTCRDASRAG